MRWSWANRKSRAGPLGIRSVGAQLQQGAYAVDCDSTAMNQARTNPSVLALFKQAAAVGCSRRSCRAP